MEEGKGKIGSHEKGTESREAEEDEIGLKFLDSMDCFLTLMDSLSATLSQAWLELAGARHSMGASRINSAMLNLKHHSAATLLQVHYHDAGSTSKHPHFTLCKWAASPDGENFLHEKAQLREDGSFGLKSNGPQLRHQGNSYNSGENDRSPLPGDDLVNKERSKSLSVFGTLVSPKLRAAQLSFETALETLVEIAYKQASMLSAYDKLQKEI